MLIMMLAIGLIVGLVSDAGAISSQLLEVAAVTVAHAWTDEIISHHEIDHRADNAEGDADEDGDEHIDHHLGLWHAAPVNGGRVGRDGRIRAEAGARAILPLGDGVAWDTGIAIAQGYVDVFLNNNTWNGPRDTARSDVAHFSLLSINGSIITKNWIFLLNRKELNKHL